MARPRTPVELPAEALRIKDFSDRELILAVDDELGRSNDEVNYVVARSMALRVFGLEETEENEPFIFYYTHCVNSRFSWMRRFGLMEKGDQKGEWRLSEEGQAMLRASLAGSVARAIMTNDDSRALVLANAVGERYASAGETAANAMRREFLFQVERRKRAG